LGLLPLHAAWTEDPNAPTGRRYALDAITFAYAPNARALAASRAVAADVQPHAVLAVDNPDGSLLFSRQEVDAVLSYFPEGCKKPLRGQAATHQAVTAELPNYPVLHFSTHGWAGWQEPLESGLLMASEPHLTLRDVLEMRLDKARLAVLSACETGIPGTKLPDEVVSLPTGLMQAGVAGVVASLWSVNDLSTAMLMERFYRLWREEDGRPPALALREAQRWLRDTTNREKADYFKRDVPAIAGARMPELVAAELYVDRMLQQEPDARDFEHPFWWAAFYLTGV
jgi:CHAT domain-containing protein